MSRPSDFDRPIPGQTVGLVSYVIFEKPRELPDNMGKCYGVFKIRGNHPNKTEAIEKSKELSELDPKNKVLVAEVGKWVPIVSNPDLFSDQTIEVKRDDKQPFALNDEVNKELRRKNDAGVREVQERMEHLKTMDERTETEGTLEAYIKARRVVTTLWENIRRYESEIKDIWRKLEDYTPRMLSMERSHPEYSEDWLEVYNKERRATRLPEYVDLPEFLSYLETERAKTVV